jgi:predicted transcriptional regulator
MSGQDEGEVTKTTVYLDAADYEQLKALARAEGRTAAELVREAVAEYARRRAGGLRPRSLGAGRSGRGDLGERSEELLGGLGRRAGGK